MDKNTLSQYGWVVIVIIVLLILIALATPFGSFVVKSVKSSVEAFDGKVGNMFDDANIDYDSPEFAESTGTEVVPVITHYSADDVAANPNLFYIGETQPEYVVAEIKPNGTLYITKNGDDSDGKMLAFTESTDYTNVEVCEGITSIPAHPFGGTSPAVSISIPTSVTKIKGTAQTFSGYTNLTTLVFKASVSAIPGSFCYNCTSLKNVTLPDNITKINGSAFRNTALEEFTIPNTVTTLGQAAFQDCASLKKVKIGNGVTSIERETFFNCSALEKITIGNSVTSIGREAFKGCTSLTNVAIPDSIITIGYYAFRECSSLETLTLGNGLQDIGNGAFQYCAVKNVVVPNSVTNIGSSAFSNCTSLESIVIPSSVATFGSTVFFSCSSLTKATVYYNPSCNYSTVRHVFTDLIILPDTSNIVENEFEGWNKLARITVDSGNAVYDSRNNCNAIIEKTTNKLVLGCKNTVIPNSVTVIGSYAFDSFAALQSITIPSNVNTISQNAFSENHELRTVTFLGNNTVIEENSLSKCTVLSLIRCSAGSTADIWAQSNGYTVEYI